MVYASGWNPAYSFDDVGAAALPAAAAAVGLEKLAIMGAQLPALLVTMCEIKDFVCTLCSCIFLLASVCKQVKGVHHRCAGCKKRHVLLCVSGSGLVVPAALAIFHYQ